MSAGLLDAIDCPDERAEILSRLRHDVARRTRSATRTSRTLKVCAACGKAKEHTAFGAHSGRADGLQPYCRGCR